MHDVLVYLLNSESVNEIRKFFDGESYRVTIIEDLDDAVLACRQELYDIAIAWPATYEKTADLITLFDANQLKYMPIVAVTRDEKQLPHLLRLPIAELIKLPIPRLEFFYILDHLLDDIDVHATVVEGANWQGSLAEYNLIDLLQMMESGERSEELVVRCGDHTGEIFFRNGKIVAAKFNELHGMAALYKLAFWPKGQFQTKTAVAPLSEHIIKKSNQEILLDLVETLHKQEQLYEDLPGLEEELLKNPLAPAGQLTPLQDKIASSCEKPLSLFNLLLLLAESNEDILSELKALQQMNIVGERKEVEAQIKEKGESGLTKMISTLFKKKTTPEEGYYYYQGFIEESKPHGLLLRPLRLKREDLDKIQNKLGELLK
jgi:hypothetical protein